MGVVRGDQIPLSIAITSDGKPVKPEQIRGLKISINNRLFLYPDGEAEYNESAQKWEVPVTQEMTLTMGEKLDVGVQVNFGGNPELIKTSPTTRVGIQSSKFNEFWS